MIGIKEIKQISSYEGKRGPLVSLYVNTNRARYEEKKIFIKYKDVVKSVTKYLSSRDQKRIFSYIKNKLKKSSKGVVFFVASDDNFFKVKELSRPVETIAFAGERSYIRPLLRMIDEYERYLVALIDEKKARLFVIYLGEIEESKELVNYYYIQKTQKGGWSQARYQRHAEEHFAKHLKNIKTAISSISKRKKFARIILAGTQESIREFEQLLNKAEKNKVVGEFPMQMTASDNDILKKSLDVEDQIEREKESQLVDQLFDALGKKNKGVVGIEQVAKMVQEGRATMLLIDDRFKISGYHCPNCEFISVKKYPTCPYCKERMVAVSDVINRLVKRGLLAGAEIEFVKNNKKLNKRGKIGAIVRF